MSFVPVDPNTAEPLEILAVDSNGAALTGVSDLVVRVHRRSDGFFYDWSDDAFKAGASVVQIEETLAEVSATFAPGLYSVSWPGAAAGSYLAIVTQDPGTTVKNVPATIDLRVGQLAAPGDAMDLVADAVDGTAVAASAVTEFQSGLATAAALADVQADTDNIQTRLPAALVGGRIDASVGAIANDTITAAAIATGAIDADAIAADAVAELQSGLATSAEVASVQADTDDIQTRLPATLVSGRIDASVGAMAAGVVTAAAVATDAIDGDAIAASAVTEIQSGLATAAAVAALPTAAQNADAVLDEALSGHVAAGSAGEALGRLDATISSRSSHSAGDVWAVGSRTLTGIGASGIASQVSVDALPTAAAIADSVLDESVSEHAAAGSAGQALGRVDVAVSTRASHAAADVWAVGTRTLSGIGSSGIASQASVDAIPTAGETADAVLDELVTDHTTSNSVGARLGLIDVAVSTRSTLTAAQVDTQLSGAHGAGSWATATGFATPGDVPSAATISDAVWDELLSGHAGAGSAGAALSASGTPPTAAAIADAVWDELLSGHAGAGSAGAAIALLDVAVSSRATAASVWTTAEGGSAGSLQFAITLLRKHATNRLEVSTASSGAEILYDDDGTTPLRTWSLRDGTGAAITTPTGSPARRGAAT